jgi:hypothetical protein
MHPQIHLKECVTSLIIGVMIVIVLFSAPLDFASNLEPMAYAQENSTLILDDMRAIMRDQQHDLSSINNKSSAQAEALTRMGTELGKEATQATYTALSVFFLGLGLVIFGLRLTTRAPPKVARFFTIMVWALTLPVCALIGLYQVGVLSGNPLTIYRANEPFLLLSFLMYIPISIVLFILLGQRRMIHHQAASVDAQAASIATQDKKNPIQELERLVTLKEKGAITDEEFQNLKKELLSRL